MASHVQTGFVKQSSPIELASINKDVASLPHLVSSLAVPGLPPSGLSTLADEAAERLLEFLKRWHMTSVASFAQFGISSASTFFPGVVSCDRLTAVSTQWTLFVILDDAFFDPHKTTLRESLQDQCAVDSTIFQSPDKIREFAQNLDVLFRQEAPPHDPIKPIEGMTWELGQEFRRLSNPTWFTRFANAVLDYYNASIDCFAADMTGDHSHTRDLESYTRMRTREFGSRVVVLQTEFARNEFLPDEVRVHPAFTQMTNAAAIQIAFVNDIFSYAKEVLEANSRNLIKVLMESEGLLLPEAAWKAVNLTNSYSRMILELEKELPTLPAVGCFVTDLKLMISGHIRLSSMNKRYRCQDSPFPELRPDVISTGSYDPRLEGLTGARGRVEAH